MRFDAYKKPKMKLQPRIETLQSKKLIGKKLTMSIANNKTGELWQSFMPKRNEISKRVTNDFISLQQYNEPIRFGDVHQEFEKWALAEVSSIENIPDEMESFVLEGGLYAVFIYKGLSSDPSVFIYIFSDWLPKSEYVLDQRPHFEVLGEKYKNNDPNSEEEIWIPIRKKK